jgi:hypothetical protein
MFCSLAKIVNSLIMLLFLGFIIYLVYLFFIKGSGKRGGMGKRVS